MVYAKWFLFLLIGVPFELFAKLLAPVLACFVKDDGWLPKWLWMFQTPDNPCDGDRGHRERWPRDGVFWTWMRRCAWLFRNSAAGWKIWGNSQADIASDPYCPHWAYCNLFKGSGREDNK